MWQKSLLRNDKLSGLTRKHCPIFLTFLGYKIQPKTVVGSNKNKHSWGTFSKFMTFSTIFFTFSVKCRSKTGLGWRFIEQFCSCSMRHNVIILLNLSLVFRALEKHCGRNRNILYKNSLASQHATASYYYVHVMFDVLNMYVLFLAWPFTKPQFLARTNTFIF